jgi:hypothetical protein
MRIESLTGVTLCCALLLSCQNGDSGVKAEPRPNLPAQQRVIGEYLLTPAEGCSQGQFTAAAQEALAPYGVLMVETLSIGIVRVRLAKDPGPEAVSAAVKSAPEIKAVQPNFIYRAFDPRPGAPVNRH